MTKFISEDQRKLAVKKLVNSFAFSRHRFFFGLFIFSQQTFESFFLVLSIWTTLFRRISFGSFYNTNFQSIANGKMLTNPLQMFLIRHASNVKARLKFVCHHQNLAHHETICFGRYNTNLFAIQNEFKRTHIGHF